MAATIDMRGGAMEKFQLGVLLVHGIGTQRPRDTLVRWGDALLNVIGRATKEGPGQTTPIVGHADAGDRSGENPAEVAVTIRCDGRARRNGCSAKAGGRTAFRRLPIRSWYRGASARCPGRSRCISRNATGRRSPTASRTRKLWAGAKAVLKLLVAMALAPLFIALLALVLVLGLLPIPQLRSLILSAQTTLIGTVGDSLAFVESPIRAALIRDRFSRDSRDLKAAASAP